MSNLKIVLISLASGLAVSIFNVGLVTSIDMAMRVLPAVCK